MQCGSELVDSVVRDRRRISVHTEHTVIPPRAPSVRAYVRSLQRTSIKTDGFPRFSPKVQCFFWECSCDKCAFRCSRIVEWWLICWTWKSAFAENDMIENIHHSAFIFRIFLSFSREVIHLSWKDCSSAWHFSRWWMYILSNPVELWPVTGHTLFCEREYEREWEN